MSFHDAATTTPRHPVQNRETRQKASTMKILIVGSSKQLAETQKQQFALACRQIGAELARRKHTIVVGSKNPETADPHVLAAANEVAGKHRVVIVRGEDNREAPQQTDYPNLQLVYRRQGHTWSVARAFQLREADGAIAIGGGKGTLQVGLTAPALEKPILGVKAFGGSGLALWNAYKSDYSRIGLSDDELGALEADAWHDNSGAEVVKAVEHLVRRNPYQTHFVPVLCGILMVALALMALWVTVFVNPELLRWADNSSTGANTFTYAVFSLIAISALLGAGMRTALRMLEGRVISFVQLLHEVTVGLFLAFAFVLIYLSTGILMHGNVTLDLGAFRNAAVTTSLTGFVVAFLAEQSAEKLRQQLTNLL
jgi:hypothetical protein